MWLKLLCVHGRTGYRAGREAVGRDSLLFGHQGTKLAASSSASDRIVDQTRKKTKTSPTAQRQAAACYMTAGCAAPPIMGVCCENAVPRGNPNGPDGAVRTGTPTSGRHRCAKRSERRVPRSRPDDAEHRGPGREGTTSELGVLPAARLRRAVPGPTGRTAQRSAFPCQRVALHGGVRPRRAPSRELHFHARRGVQEDAIMSVSPGGGRHARERENSADDVAPSQRECRRRTKHTLLLAERAIGGNEPACRISAIPKIR